MVKKKYFHAAEFEEGGLAPKLWPPPPPFFFLYAGAREYFLGPVSPCAHPHKICAR